MQQLLWIIVGPVSAGAVAQYRSYFHVLESTYASGLEVHYEKWTVGLTGLVFPCICEGAIANHEG